MSVEIGQIREREPGGELVEVASRLTSTFMVRVRDVRAFDGRGPFSARTIEHRWPRVVPSFPTVDALLQDLRSRR